eukprot:gene3739-13796_t
MDLYIGSGPDGTTPSSRDSGLIIQKLGEIWERLYKLFQDDRGRWLEAKSWFLSTIAGLTNLSAQAQRACLMPYLTPPRRMGRGTSHQNKDTSRDRSEERSKDGSKERSRYRSRDRTRDTSPKQAAEDDEGSPEGSSKQIQRQLLQIACELIPGQVARVAQH